MWYTKYILYLEVTMFESEKDKELYLAETRVIVGEECEQIYRKLMESRRLRLPGYVCMTIEQHRYAVVLWDNSPVKPKIDVKTLISQGGWE